MSLDDLHAAKDSFDDDAGNAAPLDEAAAPAPPRAAVSSLDDLFGAPKPTDEELDTAPTDDAAAEAMAAAEAAAIEPVARAAAQASAPAATEATAVSESAASADDVLEEAVPAASNLEDELDSVVVARAIDADALAPPTKTQEEAEQAVVDSAMNPAADPGTDGTLKPKPPEAAAPAAAPAAASTDKKVDGPTDPSDLSKLELDDATVAAIGGLLEPQRKLFLSDLFAKQKQVAELEAEKADAAAKSGKRERGGGGGFGAALASGIKSAFVGFNNMASAAVFEKTLRDSKDYLAAENVRNRVLLLRKEEILQSADKLAKFHRRLEIAAKRLNSSIAGTEAGKKAELEIQAVLARHPDLTRERVLELSKQDLLAAETGEPDLIKAHMDEAFKDPEVKTNWESLEEEATYIEKHSEALIQRVSDFEDHFPDRFDAEKMAEVVTEAMAGIEKGYTENAADSPEAKKAMSERLDDLMIKFRAFLERLMAKLGLGPKGP